MTTFEQLERVIAEDPGLSLKLVKLANSAFFGGREPVGSIRQALMALGSVAVRRWATLFMLAGISDSPSDLLEVGLLRARLCELVASRNPDAEADRAFTVGLFSVVDALLGMRMPALLEDLPFDDRTTRALGAHEGPEGRILGGVLAYERGDFDGCARARCEPGRHRARVPRGAGLVERHAGPADRLTYSVGSTREASPRTTTRSRARPTLGAMNWADRRVMDAVLAVGIGALQLFGTRWRRRTSRTRAQLDALAVLLLGGGALALIARRRHPVAVFAFAFVTTFTYALLDYPGGPIWGTLIVAFVTVQTTGHRLVGYVGIASATRACGGSGPRDAAERRRGARVRRLDAGAIAATEAWRRAPQAYAAEAEQARRSEQRLDDRARAPRRARRTASR